jgi:hypothetical protein
MAQRVAPRHSPFRWAVRIFWLVQTIKGQKRPDYIGEWSLG